MSNKTNTIQSKDCIPRGSNTIPFFFFFVVSVHNVPCKTPKVGVKLFFDSPNGMRRIKTREFLDLGTKP